MPDQEAYRVPDDIIDVIRGDCSIIARRQDQFTGLTGQGGDPGSRYQVQAITWHMLASLIEKHLSAEDELCAPAIYRARPDGPARARTMLDDHEDIREIIREARLQPTRSRLWWQLAMATVTAWTRHLHRDQHGILNDLRHADPSLRQQLARQWRTFTQAQPSGQD